MVTYAGIIKRDQSLNDLQNKLTNLKNFVIGGSITVSAFFHLLGLCVHKVGEIVAHIGMELADASVDLLEHSAEMLHLVSGSLATLVSTLIAERNTIPGRTALAEKIQRAPTTLLAKLKNRINGKYIKE